MGATSSRGQSMSPTFARIRASVVGVMVLLGCAQTHVASVVAPEAQSTVYHRILVLFPVADLAARQLVEDSFGAVSDCSGAQGSFMPCPTGPPPDSIGATFIPSYNLLFPGRPFDNVTVSRVIAEHNLGAALVIILGTADPSIQLIEQAAMARCVLWPSNQDCEDSGIATAAYDMSHPWSGFTLVMFDTHTDSVVWVATTTAGGNAIGGTSSVFRSLVMSTKERLRQDSLVPAP